MGSPATYADLWKDESYVKTKEILKCGVYEDFFETFRDEETELIKESWEKYGLYGKDKKGSCLNCNAGRMVHPFFFTGENSYMKKPGARIKQSKTMKQYYKDNPETRTKVSETRKQYFKDNPEARTKVSETRKQYLKDNPDKNPMRNPESRAKVSETRKQYFKDNPEARLKKSKLMKQYCKDNPDKNPMRNPDSIKRMLESRKRNKMLRPASQKTTQPLGDFFQ
jgi:hypothetical protein